MQCPRCGTELARYDERDKWRCATCNGVVVGADQLAVEIGDRASEVLTGEADPARPAIHPCPKCAFPMTPYTIDTIELDRCVDDGLVWFDGGEIGKVRATIPLPEDAPLLTNTLGFLQRLRAEQRAAAAAVTEIPAAEPLVIAPGEWQARTLCPDGGCNGVLGPDGVCHVCGKRPDTDVRSAAPTPE